MNVVQDLAKLFISIRRERAHVDGPGQTRKTGVFGA